MNDNLWIIYALGASVMWGLGYVLSEKILQMGVNPAFLLIISGLIMIPILMIFDWFGPQQGQQWGLFINNKKLMSTTLLMSFLFVGGNLFILQSIKEKNATLASLIEISYPMFTCLFTWMLFKEVQVNIRQAIGGAVVLSGVYIIFISS